MIRHKLYIIEKETNRLAKFIILFEGILADEEFYKNLGIELDEDGNSELVDVTVNDLFTETIRFIRRTYKDRELLNIGQELDNGLQNNKIMESMLTINNNIYFRIREVYNELIPYMKEYKFDEMKEKFELKIQMG